MTIQLPSLPPNIDDIVAGHDRAIELYIEAFEKIAEADAAIKRAYAEIDHVTHALKFLKPGGWLLAIMSAGTEFRETRKAAAFRKLIDDRKGWMIDLPAGSFAEVGANVNTVLVGIGLSRSWGL